MDEYISINNDNESDIMNLCKAVDLHALMIQESYYEDIDVVESYIESVIYDYSTGAVQEADSEDVFIDPRVVKAAKVYKHNKDNPSQTVFIDPKAVNMMAYNHNSKEHLKKLLGPVIKDMINSGEAKHINLEDISPIYKLEKAESLLDTVKREKKDLKDIKNNKSKDKSERLADLNKFMYDNMSDDYAKRIKRLKSIKPGENSPSKKYKLEGVEMNDEYIMTNDDIVEESYTEPDNCDNDDVTLEDVESYLEYTKTNINDAMELRDKMVQEGYEYEDLSLEDVNTYIEYSINEYNNIVDVVNDIIQEADETTDDSMVDDFEESGDSEKRGFSDTIREAAKRGSAKIGRNINYITGSNIIEDREETALDKRRSKIKERSDKLRKARHDNTEALGKLVDKQRAIRYNHDIDDDQKQKLYNQLDREFVRLENRRNKIDKLSDRNGENYKNYLNDFDTHLKNKSRDLQFVRDTPERIAKFMNKLRHGKEDDGDFKESYELKNSYQEEFDLELDEPLTAFEFFDESYEPDNTPIVPLSDEGIEFAQEVTLAELGAVVVVTAAAIALIKTGKSLINRLKSYGRFPKDMKRVYDIIESENFEASENKRALKKAFKALSKDLAYMLHSFGSRWKITVNEAEEIRKLKRHVDDLYTRGHMLTGNKRLSDKRRVGERIEGFLKQGNKVLEILNKTIYKNTSNDSVTEWMV